MKLVTVYKGLVFKFTFYINMMLYLPIEKQYLCLQLKQYLNETLSFVEQFLVLTKVELLLAQKESYVYDYRGKIL